jgi:cytochrome c oxidase cbb3-type subunit 3
MLHKILFGSSLVSLFFFVFMACTEQHDPRPDWKRFTEERAMAHRQLPELKEDGSLPDPVNPSEEAAVSGIDEKYNTFCGSCHGVDGAANTATAQALNPQPRNFKDVEWQNKVSDEHIAKVIAQGGSSVGLAATMAAFGSLLSEDEIKQLVEKVRSFATP